jgi:hypothetical protein
MTTRTAQANLTFARPFTLAGIDGTLPAGTYRVDTDEELVEGLSFFAWRRVATTIHITRDGATRVYPVKPADLAAGLAGTPSP